MAATELHQAVVEHRVKTAAAPRVDMARIMTVPRVDMARIVVADLISMIFGALMTAMVLSTWVRVSATVVKVTTVIADVMDEKISRAPDMVLPPEALTRSMITDVAMDAAYYQMAIYSSSIAEDMAASQADINQLLPPTNLVPLNQLLPTKLLRIPKFLAIMKHEDHLTNIKDLHQPILTKVPEDLTTIMTTNLHRNLNPFSNIAAQRNKATARLLQLAISTATADPQKLPPVVILGPTHPVIKKS